MRNNNLKENFKIDRQEKKPACPWIGQQIQIIFSWYFLENRSNTKPYLASYLGEQLWWPGVETLKLCLFSLCCWWNSRTPKVSSVVCTIEGGERRSRSVGTAEPTVWGEGWTFAGNVPWGELATWGVCKTACRGVCGDGKKGLAFWTGCFEAGELGAVLEPELVFPELLGVDDEDEVVEEVEDDAAEFESLAACCKNDRTRKNRKVKNRSGTYRNRRAGRRVSASLSGILSRGRRIGAGRVVPNLRTNADASRHGPGVVRRYQRYRFLCGGSGWCDSRRPRLTAAKTKKNFRWTRTIRTRSSERKPYFVESFIRALATLLSSTNAKGNIPIRSFNFPSAQFSSTRLITVMTSSLRKVKQPSSSSFVILKS